MSAEQPLTGRTALVTGAGRGLGRAYALHLAALGADVAVADVDLRSYRAFAEEEALMTAGSTGEEVAALGRGTLELTFDVTDAAAVQAAVDELRSAWGRLDVVVCNAGGGQGDPAQSKASSMDLDEFDQVLRRNLHGTVHTCTAVAPMMKEQRSGKIITVASIAGQRPNRDGGYAHYGVAKAGVIMYTRYLANDLGPFGITANCIAPGFIATGRLVGLYERTGTERTVRGIASGRLGTPEDCAAVVGFLASPAADYLNGALIPVDGAAS